MDSRKHPHFAAAQMAALDMNNMIKSMKDSVYGQFPMRGPSRGAVARQERLANAPPDIKKMLDDGYSMDFVDRLARLTEAK